MSPKQLSALLILSALWGGSFLFMRIAAPSLGPIVLIWLRVGLAGLALLGYGAVVGRLARPGRLWKEYLVIGAINSALPFCLIAFSSVTLPASMTAPLNATTPLFGAVIAAVWIGETLTVRKVLGLLMGVVGVAVLMGLGPIPWSGDTMLAAGASLLAAVSYGVGAVYTKARVQGGDARVLSTYSQLFAALLLTPLVPFAWPQATPSGEVVISVVALAILCTSVGYLLYFYLIMTAGPTRATMVTYLSPAFGMLWGTLLLNERLGVASFVGFGLILASVGLVTGAGRLREGRGSLGKQVG
ncbi:MAG TPA: DMT family transporter [Symbiobacteriaceae bacterium]|jgi:drug/metabolite transporter (DMT)-like permease|nr:DMT family transporter [Symbiobacteriaceae bacterium]